MCTKKKVWKKNYQHAMELKLYIFSSHCNRNYGFREDLYFVAY